MKTHKIYEAYDQMITLIGDNYNILQSLGRFGINLGFGDKTVAEVCEEQGVDTYTFLALVNFSINGFKEIDDVSKLSVDTLLSYLRSCHRYYLDFQLPFIRKELTQALDERDGLAGLILKIYDEYALSIHQHMKYEEKEVFPYVEQLLEGKSSSTYSIDVYSRNHDHAEQKLRELKNIIIKYLPSDGMGNNLLLAALHDIFNNEEWLIQHTEVEERIFIPAIRHLENKMRQNDVSVKISRMLHQNKSQDGLSARERDVVVALVQGMSNKEIADHLCISTNTVITHRRNIAKKLQIHSPAGLTIYAIVNNLVDISSVKL
ncbi:MAG: hemerythrin domain-containing protein [Prevotella sp.]|nr:hemerythrin domain-containing protein [Prevotella sp.]